jgi:hypothetical protein
MREYSLEVSYRRGRVIAAYLDVLRRKGQKSYRTIQAEPGLVIDLNRRGRPTGVEILYPSKLTLRRLNCVLRELGLPTVKRADIAPLSGP